MPPEPILAVDRTAFLPELQRAGTAATAHAPLTLAEEKLEEWREILELSAAQFDELLASEGLGRTELTQILAGRELESGSGPEPAWRATLRAVLDRIGDGSAARSLAPAAADSPPFAEVLDGFVAVAWDDLRAHAARPAELELDWTALAPGLQAHLRARLLRVCQRTLVLELNVARLEGWLDGGTPAARYGHYVATLRRDPSVWVRLLDEYQVMARLLCTTMACWVARLGELLEHLAADHAQLVGRGATPALLPDRRRLRLVELTGGLSDPQRGGRGVWRLAFRDDSAAAPSPPVHHLVYKPRSLAADVHFQALLAFCNQAARRGVLGLADLRHTTRAGVETTFPELRLLALLDRGDHGWVECVAPRDAADPGGAARFYLRQGAYLALLYVLDGADLRCDNVIASGEHPMLVDLETLFHPWLALKPDETAGPADARARAQTMLRDSVMRTALVPGLAWGDRDRAGVTIGGLGDGRTQVSPRASLAWAAPGSDATCACARRHDSPRRDNVARIDGAMVSASHHIEELVAGFEAMMRFLVAEREALLGPGGAIRAFADDPMRRLLRPTSAYAHLLEPSCHPDHLRDAMDRERLFDLLWKVSQGKPRLLRVVAMEKEDLRHGDVPYFGARPGSCDLWDSRGERIPGFFAAPPLELAASQLAATGPREIAEQVFILRGAVSAMSIAAPAAPDRARAPLSARGRTALDAAVAIGAQLEATAILGDRDATWLGMDGSRDGAGVELAVLRGGLYDGTGGIALFLGYLGFLTGEHRFTRLAMRAALATRSALDSASDEPGGLSGALSHVYVLLHLAALWGDRSLVPPLGPILDRAATSADGRFDAICGAAGCILALLAIHELTGDDQALALAAAAGRALAAGATYGKAGASWPCAVRARHLLGFCHSASGIGAALHRLSRLAADRAVIDVNPAALAALGDAAFAFAHGKRDATAGHWPDRRDEAPGIALSRLSASSLDPGTPARRDLELAIAATLAGPVQRGQTLCHGELGDLMIVHRAAARLGRADWQHQVDRRLEVTLARLFERGPDCGVEFPASAPALMDGVAGIGYGLLYLTQPSEVPFVLDLSPCSFRS